MPKTFECGECGKDTPIEQIGLDEMCDDCFDEEYPDKLCRNTNLLTGEICHYQANDRIDLEQHWDESPNHNQ